MNPHATVVLRKRRANKRDAKRIRHLTHRLRQGLRVVHDDRHCTDDVRRADRLIGRERGQKENVIPVVQQYVAHEVVRNNRADLAVGLATRDELSFEGLYNV